jgi:tetratricopeptide (TPR) repeat protein
MRQTALFLALSVLLVGAGEAAAQMAIAGKPINELPMYGGARKNRAARQADAAFLAQCDAQYPSRRAASQYHAARGMDYAQQGDAATATKRFNQAWLLDSTNAEVYWGFGVVSSLQGDYDAALGFLQRSQRQLPDNPALLADLGNTFLRRHGRTRRAEDLTQGLRCCEQALAAPTTGSGLPPARAVPVYVNLAVGYYHKKDYAQAWQWVARAEAVDAAQLNPGFLEALSQALPRPK